MANRRALVKRRKAVRNTKKITRTMQLIATARFQAAMNRALATKPYSEKLAEMIGDLSQAAGGDSRHPLMEVPDTESPSVVLALTSNRGLCGGYNANVLRAATAHLDGAKADGVSTEVHMVGTKGINFFRFRGRDVDATTTDIDDKPRFDQVHPLADDLMERFTTGKIGSVYVAYMRFHSPGRQQAEVIQLLPLAPPDPAEADDTSTEDSTAGQHRGRQATYEYSPSPEELLDTLLPAAVRMRLFQAFNDAAVSEQIARMVAMKAATEAAEEMIRALTQEYNRARQTAITMELLDIVGGANALA